MQSLITHTNLARPDELYDMVLHTHEGLSKEQSDALNARLILILMNHIGDETVIREALTLAQSPAKTK
jgi:Protein of unknown function (DUF2783)